MPEFILRVGTPEGDVIERHVRAASLRAAREEMLRQGLHVFEAKRGALTAGDFLPRLRKAIVERWCAVEHGLRRAVEGQHAVVDQDHPIGHGVNLLAPERCVEEIRSFIRA